MDPFFEPVHIIFFKEDPFNFIIYFWRNFIIFLSLIYLISISFNYHNLANIFIHVVVEWHQIFLFPFFKLTNITHILAFKVILYVRVYVFCYVNVYIYILYLYIFYTFLLYSLRSFWSVFLGWMFRSYFTVFLVF